MRALDEYQTDFGYRIILLLYIKKNKDYFSITDILL